MQEFFGHGCKDGSVAAVVPKPTIPEPQCSPIGHVANQPEGIVHSGFCHSANHDCFVRIPPSEPADPTTGTIQRDISPLVTERA
jgi:hypothetical protein